MTDIREIHGMPRQLAAIFKENGIQNNLQLLEVLRQPIYRQYLAEAIGVEAQDLLRLANRAELVRIRGLGRTFQSLMEAAGVQSLTDLAQNSPEQLHKRLLRANSRRQIARQVPSPRRLAQWVSEARQLPRVIEY